MLSFRLATTHIHRTLCKNSFAPIRAYLHGTSIHQSISPLRMPALSPTMESGQISRWNVKTGDRFSAGEVLLTVETDKAEMDVEAQDDGYMGPQFFGPGTTATTKTVNVGELIAVLGEMSDDVSGSLNIPTEWHSNSSSSSSGEPPQKLTPNPTEPPQSDGTNVQQPLSLKAELPLSPAVSRLLHSLRIQDTTKIRGTGLRGRLTKGDVLTHLKLASSPSGTAEKMIQADAAARSAERSQLGLSSKSIELEAMPLDGLALRRYITEGLSHLTIRPTTTTSTGFSFDSVLKDYDSPSPEDTKLQKIEKNLSATHSSHDNYFYGLDQV